MMENPFPQQPPPPPPFQQHAPPARPSSLSGPQGSSSNSNSSSSMHPTGLVMDFGANGGPFSPDGAVMLSPNQYPLQLQHFPQQQHPQQHQQQQQQQQQQHTPQHRQHQHQHQHQHQGLPTPLSPLQQSGAPLPVPAAQGMPVAPPGSSSSNASAFNHGRGSLDNGARPLPGASNVNGSFEYSRSPPGARSTSHVPCKFYRNGTCQAGNACPFSHTLEPMADVPCKYFAKGNCKFGPKCALAHILPDGRRVNRPPFDMGAEVRYNMAARGGSGAMSGLSDPMGSPLGLPPGAGLASRSAGGPFGPGSLQDDMLFQAGSGGLLQKQFPNISSIDDRQYTSPPGSNYGSPPGDGGRLMHLSPSIRAIDAPLPASFESQGISHFARYGPSAASVPSRFGFNPLTSTSATTSTVTSTAFGNLNSIARNDPVNIVYRSTANNTALTSSPPASSNLEAFPRRILHSETASKPQLISSSLPAPYLIDEEYDEGLLPSNIRDIWATSSPTSKPVAGRRSLDAEDCDLLLSSQRQSTSGFGSPAESKVGSPTNASPNPSRFGQFFAQRNQQQQQQQQQQQARDDMSPIGSGSTNNHDVGHVGSPRRKSNLIPDTIPLLANSSSPSSAIRPPLSRPRSRDVSPFGMSSPPMRASAGQSMLSQQFGSLRIATLDSESNLRPAIIRNAASSSGSTGAGLSSALTSEITEQQQRERERARLYRVVSNSSIGRNDVIEEEPELCLFSMEDEDNPDHPHYHQHHNHNHAHPEAHSQTTSQSSPYPAQKQHPPPQHHQAHLLNPLDRKLLGSAEAAGTTGTSTTSGGSDAGDSAASGANGAEAAIVNDDRSSGAGGASAGGPIERTAATAAGEGFPKGAALAGTVTGRNKPVEFKIMSSVGKSSGLGNKSSTSTAEHSSGAGLGLGTGPGPKA